MPVFRNSSNAQSQSQYFPSPCQKPSPASCTSLFALLLYSSSLTYTSSPDHSKDKNRSVSEHKMVAPPFKYWAELPVESGVYLRCQLKILVSFSWTWKAFIFFVQSWIKNISAGFQLKKELSMNATERYSFRTTNNCLKLRSHQCKMRYCDLTLDVDQ